jgi:hypothetical protein
MTPTRAMRAGMSLRLRSRLELTQNQRRVFNNHDAPFGGVELYGSLRSPKTSSLY